MIERRDLGCSSQAPIVDAEMMDRRIDGRAVHMVDSRVLVPDEGELIPFARVAGRNDRG